jgi:hypothetical protein
MYFSATASLEEDYGSMNLDSNLDAKLRAPGDEWSLPPTQKIQGRKEDQDRFHRTPLVASCFKATRGEAARIENAFITLDPMQMMACRSN